MAKDQLPFSLPFRQVHLDFHTGPWIPDVGTEFDPKAFARTVKQANINSITVFAKCHHGHLYYNTKRPERHPGLSPNLDLLRGQVDALHAEGIRAPIYVSVQCDEYAADTHPEWIAQNKDGSHVGPKPLEPGWQIMDMASPYVDFCADQTAEVLKLFKPVDGIFFDMCWDQPSWNPYRLEAMAKDGFNPESDEDHARYATIVAHRYMKRYYDMVKAASKDATVFFNCRPFFQLAQDIAYQTQAEIEALPTGGWGYMYFPINVRYARTFGKPYMGMTARFHKSWADFGGLKPYAALEYETAQMIAHGARCSIGDQLHPRGTLDKASYDLIGQVYKRVADREEWLENATPVSQIGLFQRPTGVTSTTQSTSRTDEGATRILTQLRHQFDVVQEASDLSAYDLLVLPDGIPMTDKLAKALKAYLKGGGMLLASGHSGIAPNGTDVLLPELGIKAHGESPYLASYMRLGKDVSETDGALASYDADHVLYDRTIRVTPDKGATALARIVEPYFDRSWKHFSSHRQTPGDKLSRFAAAVRTDNTAYISFPVFNSFAEHGNLPYRLLVRNVLALLLSPKGGQLLTVGGPSYLEATVQRQRANGATRHIVHLLGYIGERRAPGLDLIEDIVPVDNVPVSLKLPKAPKRVYLAPTCEELPFTYNNGRVNTTVPRLMGHAMIVFE